MHRSSIKLILATLLVIVFSGCDVGIFSPEGKINAAIPPASEITLAKNDLLAAAPSDQRKSLEQEFSGRLKLRALSCSKGYSPSWLASTEQILKKFPSRTCFNEADADIAKWIGLRRTGILLAMPSLRPIPAAPAKYLIGDGHIQSAVFAEKAGVALFVTQKSLQIIDMELGKPLFEEPKPAGQSGALSPNGRLFTSGADGRVKIRSAETGAVLVELAKLRGHEIQWLDNRAALYNTSDNNKVMLLDFSTGKETPVPEIGQSQSKVIRIADSENQFLVGSYRAISKIELVKKEQELTINLIEEKPITGGWSPNTANLGADGQYLFSVNRDLMLISTTSLDHEKIIFQPFGLQAAIPTADPDKIFITGYMRSSIGNGARSFLYSIGSRSLTPVDRTKLISERVIYVPSLKRQAVISESKVALLDELPLGEAVTLDKFIAAATEEANQRKLEEFDRMQRGQQNDAAYPSGAVASSSAYRLGGTAPLADLAKDAQVEAIGVYQAANASKRSGESRTGQVEVRIRRSPKPVVLVLSSYEPVRWNLVSEPGVRIAAVLLSGYHQSQVVGAGTARVVTLGRSYAYQNGTPQYRALENEVTMFIGKRINLFQGRYEGSSFSVGGS
ncbi:MAG: hypothetical protein A3I66_20745 [Burkholderiales bacterium RIFCSPLOWO2_02_FULL_57_36]|nr:MAG: hypothetical protein A3I66_20745 [Burkholderiales bacterium RIFCSPLOWO2_02_FULL_57_36]